MERVPPSEPGPSKPRLTAARGVEPSWMEGWLDVSPRLVGLSLAEHWDGVGISIEAPPAPAKGPVGQASRREPKSGTPKSSMQAPAGSTIVDARQAAAVPRSVTPIAEAEHLARSATSLEALAAVLARYTGTGLHTTARQMVFADGVADAEIMVIGEAPGGEEDEQGKPFVGISGQLLDKMFAAIGLSRRTNLYITNIVNWRPPGNRNPSAEELALSRPFIERHITLKAPKLIVLVGAVSAQSLLGTNTGITRLAGQTHTLTIDQTERPTLALLHPAYLLRRPQEKAAAWQHLKRLAALIDSLGLRRGRGL